MICRRLPVNTKDAAANMSPASSQVSTAAMLNSVELRIAGNYRTMQSTAHCRRNTRRAKMENKLQFRSSSFNFETREDGENPVIEGYFSVFNTTYDMGFDMSESVAPGAFTKSLSNDVRALINHDTTLVLGRTSAHTLELREDSHGLWGKITINPKDSDAMNLYERVKRGDVSQCSFGFNIVSENTDIREDGSVHWTITEADLHEVSVCTFPAYEDTAVSARAHDLEEIKKRNTEKWRSEMINKLKGV